MFFRGVYDARNTNEAIRGHPMQQITTLRHGIGVKAVLAKEFTDFIGSSASSFRSFMGDPIDGGGSTYHRIYAPVEIRRARLRMLGVDAQHVDAARNPALGLPPVINSRMSKGGTGKTTIAANLASTLAMMGYKVLMIDADPQASLTGLFGIDWATEDIEHIGHIMERVSKKQPPDFARAVRPLYDHGMLDLIAADITLDNANKWMMSEMRPETLFGRALMADKNFLSRYDVIIVDSAPGTTLLTLSVMCGAGNVLTAVWMDGQSLKAMSVLSSNVAEINEAFADTGLRLSVRLVANGFHPSYQACRDAWDTLKSAYPDILDPNRIPHSSSFMKQVSLLESGVSGPVIEREPNSPASRAIIDLTKSLVRHYGIGLAGHNADI